MLLLFLIFLLYVFSSLQSSEFSGDVEVRPVRIEEVHGTSPFSSLFLFFVAVYILAPPRLIGLPLSFCYIEDTRYARRNRILSAETALPSDALLGSHRSENDQYTDYTILCHMPPTCLNLD